MATEDAQKFSSQIGIELFETSAKDNINVEEVWREGTRSHSVGQMLLIMVLLSSMEKLSS